MKLFLVLLAFLWLTNEGLKAQGILFAELKGSPVNTTNWNLAGDARAGDTPGDANTENDEIILCENKYTTSGAIFYQQPINLLVCNKWYAEFDYRMFDGNSADGIAFCFLVNPPTGFIAGGGIGIPSNPKGLMVVFDSYNNCNNSGSPCCTPKLEIRYGDGSSNYNECPDPAQPTLKDANLRGPEYRHARINYDNGKIDVYLNGIFQLSGFYPINYDGYLGFTASTGASKDLHSIKNVTIYTQSGATDAGPDTVICSGETVQLGKPPKPGYNYLWSGLTDSTVSNPSIKFINKTNHVTQYYFTLTADSSGIKCNAKDEVKVTVHPELTAKAGIDTMMCPGDSIHLYASGGNTFLWSPGNSLNDMTVYNPLAYPLVNTAYQVIVSYGALKCSDTAYTNVTIKPKPFVQAGNDTTICEGDSANIFVKGNAVTSVSWFPLTGLTQANVAKPWARPLTSTIYFGTITDTSGCKSTDSVSVNIIQQPSVSGTLFDSAVCEGKKYELDAHNPGFKYQWSTGSASRIVKLTDSGNFYVKIYNECFTDTSWFHISFRDCSGRLFMPTAFTPNNDGLNDFFTYTGQNVTNLILTIYNRWGQRVYVSNSPDAKWDGTFNGKECIMDVYIYMIKAHFLDDTDTEFKGTFTLLR